MSQYVQIQWTCASKEEAQRICKALVEKKMIACANIIPQVQSIYFWEGKVEEGEEVKVLIKTLNEKFSEILHFILKNGSYEVPEVSKFEIKEGNPAYLKWLVESVE